MDSGQGYYLDHPEAIPDDELTQCEYYNCARESEALWIALDGRPVNLCSTHHDEVLQDLSPSQVN